MSIFFFQLSGYAFAVRTRKEINYMEQHLQACSHYCEYKKGRLYLPNSAEVIYIQKLKNIGRNYLVRTQLGFSVYSTLAKIYRLLFPLRRYYSNNNLGIFITTSCNLKCVNCEVSASQAPQMIYFPLNNLKHLLMKQLVLNITGIVLC